LYLQENILGLEMSSEALQQSMVYEFLFLGVELHIALQMVKQEHDEGFCSRNWMMASQFY